MDSLTNVKAVMEAVASFKGNIEKLNNAIRDLDDNEQAFKKAWESSNAIEFFNSYTALKARLTDASKNLAKYQDKINRVVVAFNDFDTKVTYGADDNTSNPSQNHAVRE